MTPNMYLTSTPINNQTLMAARERKIKNNQKNNSNKNMLYRVKYRTITQKKSKVIKYQYQHNDKKEHSIGLKNMTTKATQI